MRETQILRGLHKARSKNCLAAGYTPGRRGVAKLEGPGTTTSDSIHGVSLSRGEAVLPAKTVEAVGAENIAALIEETNGKPPARGLRDGVKAARGLLEAFKEAKAKSPLWAPAQEATKNVTTSLGASDGSRIDWKTPSAPIPDLDVTTQLGATAPPPAPPESLAQKSARLRAKFNLPERGLRNNPAPHAGPLITPTVVEGASSPYPRQFAVPPEAEARAAARAARATAAPTAAPAAATTQAAGGTTTPADKSWGGRAKSAWGGLKAAMTGAAEPVQPAPNAPKAAPLTGMAALRDANTRLNPKLTLPTVAEMLKPVGSVARFAGKVAMPVAVGVDAADVLDVATDDRTDKLDVGNEVVSKGAKWAGAAVGGLKGAIGGAAFGGYGAIPGALLGGVAGYKAADLAINGGRYLAETETSDPSERSYGAVRKMMGTPDPNAPAGTGTGTGAEPFNPNQTAATRERTNFTPGTAGAGRGSLAPPGTVLDNGAMAPTDPRSRDMSAELNAVPAQLPSDLRKGVVHKTVDARGRTTYSGVDVGPGADGNTQFVDGLGKSLQPRGSMQLAAAGQPVAATPDGGGVAFTPSSGATPAARGGLAAGQTGVGATPAISAALQAASARGDTDAVRQFYQRDGGTFAGRTAAQDAPANDPQSVIMDRIQRGLASGQTLTAAGVAALQALNSTDKNYKANIYGSDVSRENNRENNSVQAQGNELQYFGKQAELAYNRDKDARASAQATTEKGAKEYDEFLKMNPALYDAQPDNKPPVFNEQKAAGLASYLAETAPEVMTRDGKRMSLQDAFAKANPDARSAMVKGSNDYGLREFVNQYSKDALGGKGTKGGALKIIDAGPERKAQLGDLAKNMHVKDYLKTWAPWISSQVVEVEGADGPIAVPLNEIMNAPNRRELMEAILRTSPTKK